MKILSIQSWVSDGHVGNSAALFPLQRMGAEVAAIHTVQFSNHPGHGAHTGRVYPAADTRALIAGLAAHGTLAGCDAMLTGYIGDAATGDAILGAARALRAANPAALWCCDPVMGDDGRLYVHAAIPPFFKSHAVPEADLLTPNQFELELLTGLPCTTLAELRIAAMVLRDRLRPGGPRVVLVTSAETPDAAPDRTYSLLATEAGAFLLATERLSAKFSGAGDTLAALFLFHAIVLGDPVRAAELAVGSLAGVLRHTWLVGASELLSVTAQNEFVEPSAVPRAIKL
jgi:pyridoxine kinase